MLALDAGTRCWHSMLALDASLKTHFLGVTKHQSCGGEGFLFSIGGPPKGA